MKVPSYISNYVQNAIADHGQIISGPADISYLLFYWY